MNGLRLHTGLDMRNQSIAFMQANFGKAGAHYYWISRGVDNREVRANRIRKSVGAENTFAGDLTEFSAMLPELKLLVDKVWRHCEDVGATDASALRNRLRDSLRSRRSRESRRQR
jgi:DNA polymerase IV